MNWSLDLRSRDRLQELFPIERAVVATTKAMMPTRMFSAGSQTIAAVSPADIERVMVDVKVPRTTHDATLITIATASNATSRQ